MSFVSSWGGETGPLAPIVSQANVEQREESVLAAFFVVPLVATTEPVWFEDEAEEEARRKHRGEPLPTLIDPSDAGGILEKVELALPDRLGGIRIDPPADWMLPDDFDYYAFAVQTTLLVPDKLSPRRLRLKVRLDGDTSDDQPEPPIVLAMRPRAQATEQTIHVGELKMDLMSLVNLAWPGMPKIFTANVGTSIDIHKVKPRMQAAGLMTSVCEWRVSDELLCYDLNGCVLAQVPAGMTLRVAAELHVQIERRVLGVFSKLYAKSAAPRRYTLNRKDATLDADRLDLEGKKVGEFDLPVGLQIIFRQPEPPPPVISQRQESSSYQPTRITTSRNSGWVWAALMLLAVVAIGVVSTLLLGP